MPVDKTELQCLFKSKASQTILEKSKKLPLPHIEDSLRWTLPTTDSSFPTRKRLRFRFALLLKTQPNFGKAEMGKSCGDYVKVCIS